MTTTATRAQTPTLALALWVIEQAGKAPSIYNTQPWSWEGGEDGIELWADRSRKLLVADPLGRELALSCGTALHHAEVAVRALGYHPHTELLPAPAEPDHLATLRLFPGDRTARAAVDFRALERRCTDRRRFTTWQVPDERLERLSASVGAPRVYVVPLTDRSSRLRAGLLATGAVDRRNADPLFAGEQDEWIDRSTADGMPAAVRPYAPPAPGHGLVTTSDSLVAVCTDADDVESWLLAGMALSGLWLEATIGGLTVVPISECIELGEARTALRDQVLGGLAEPQVLARVGWQEIGLSQLGRTPRRPLDDILLG
jgi:hypothetical protein